MSTHQEPRALNAEETKLLRAAIRTVCQSMEREIIPTLMMQHGIVTEEQAFDQLRTRIKLLRKAGTDWSITLSIAGMGITLTRADVRIGPRKEGHGFEEVVSLVFLSLLGWNFTLKHLKEGSIFLIQAGVIMDLSK